MKLNDLLMYKRIVIQCHDNPDADAIASGYALHTFFQMHGIDATLIYGGRNKIKKSNLTKMISLLEIPIQHVDHIGNCDLLLTVDCQYGEGNVTKFPADLIAVIDHHMVAKELPELSEVRSNLGACATLVWNMLKDEGYDANKNIKLATALYYGLYMDTGAMAELSHPLDRDIRDQANFDENIMAQLRNSNLSIEELEVAGTALLRTDMMEEYHCAIVKANRCDPNILGIISDLVLEVDIVNVCVVFTQQENGIKFSVRSCVREVMADELAYELAKGLGSGGGHMAKAGGFIRYDLFIPEYEKICKKMGMTPRYEENEDGEKVPAASACKFLLEYRIKDYFEETKIIDASQFKEESMPFAEYERKRVAFGYVEATELFAVGTRVRIRSIEEDDVIITIQDQMLFVIGNKGDINIVNRYWFDTHYRCCDWAFTLPQSEYVPSIRKDELGSEFISLMDKAKVCISTSEELITACRLEQNIKLFDLWDTKSYKKGEKGDYLVMKNKSASDLVIIGKEIFESRMRPVEHDQPEIKAVVFDLDGTLLDTIADLTDAVNAALNAVNEPERTLREVQRFVGNGIKILVQRSLQEGELDPNFDKAMEAFVQYYKNHAMDKTAPYKGIQELLYELRYRGIQLAVVSNKLDPAVKDLCEYYFDGTIQVAIGEREGVSRKPSPDSVFAALEELGVKPENALYVGDSEVDIETARNAGIPCISVEWGFKSRSFLEKHGAKTIIEVSNELLKYI